MNKQEQINKAKDIVANKYNELRLCQTDSQKLIREFLLANYVDEEKGVITILINAGYGNLKEFAEKLKEQAGYYRCGTSQMVRVDQIDELLKEYTDND